MGRLTKTLLAVVPFAASAILLTVCQAPWNLHGLAWVALVPFVLSCRPDIAKKRLAAIAYLVSFAAWMFNLDWIIPITGPGYICFALFQALYWPLLALGIRYCRRRNLPMTVAAPILFVGVESIQSFLFTGFSWYFLGHSQYANTTLIQVADIAGVFGISALIVAANGLIADWIFVMRRTQLQNIMLWISSAAVAALLIAAFLYGQYRLYDGLRENEAANYRSGPLVGSVQPNIPTVVKEEDENAQQILDDLIKQSDACLAAGAKLVLWPETIVLTPLNAGYLAYCVDDSEPRRFDRQIAAFCRDRAFVLVGAHGADIGVKNNDYVVTNKYNSAYLYTPEGKQSDRRYDKMHLVPFGEFIPCKTSFPPLYKLFMMLNPYDYDYTLTAGKEAVLFPVRIDQKDYRFGVLICYEDTDPAISRKMVYQDGKKAADWIVNISNDGWYVKFKDGKGYPSVELAQRTAISVFRCIENRISIIRSVNTGISCLIDPYGRIHNDYAAGNLPKNAMDRQAVEGWFVDKIPLNSRLSFYSRFGGWIDKLPAGILIALIILIITLLAKKRWNMRMKTLDLKEIGMYQRFVIFVCFSF